MLKWLKLALSEDNFSETNSCTINKSKGVENLEESESHEKQQFPVKEIARMFLKNELGCIKANTISQKRSYSQI